MVDRFIDYESLDIYVPILDPRDEEQLFQEARLAAFNESKGVLSDFSNHSPLAALLQGFVFAGSEIQYRNQKILPALLLTYLAKLGGKRELGSKAKAEIVFKLTKVFQRVYVIDQGTEITNARGSVRFFTVERLEIPLGVQKGGSRLSQNLRGNNIMFLLLT
ncbi:MAG: hypothetical protein HC878_00045 [Leptolyngbyaceae cyanobacterium SL_5_14]|nr:hypothetical protein [Leptolyngbyaceae cyanobacterium SL_5_14]